jgi:ATP-dependent helicase/DNAse subunit B
LVMHTLLRQAVNEVLAPSDISGTVQSVRRAVRDLLLLELAHPENITPKNIAWLVELADHYRALLRENALVDPVEVMVQAAKVVGAPLELTITGYPFLDRDEAAFVDAICADGSQLTLPHLDVPLFSANARAAKWLEAQGWQVERNTDVNNAVGQIAARRYALGQAAHISDDEGDGLAEQMTGVVYANVESEVRGVLTEVKRLLHAGVDAKTIALVVNQDDRYGSLVKAGASEYEIPVRTFYQVPAYLSRLGRWLERLIEVVRTDGDFEITRRFLAHPFNMVSADTWDALRQTMPQTLHQWQDIEPKFKALQLPASAPFAAYSQQFARIKQAFLPATLTEDDASARVLFRNIEGSLTYLVDKGGDAVWSLERFLTTLSDMLRLFSVPSESDKEGVPLHTPPAVLGAAYDYVFVLGAAEGMLPPAISEDPRLDFLTRKQLQRQGHPITTAADAARRERMLTYAALACARARLQVSYPQQAFGQSMLASEVFARLGIEPALVPKQPASRGEARAILLQTADPSDDVVDDVLTRAQHAFTVETQRESAAPHDAYDGVTGVPIDINKRTLSASQLVAFGQCPYRWFAQRVLRLKEPAEPDAELTPTLRGSLYHKVLEIALAPLVGERLSAVEQRDIAVKQLDEAFAKAEKQVDVMRLPNWQKQRQEHIDHLKTILQRDSFFQEGRVIWGLEQRFNTTWHDLTVIGVIDRVDLVKDGAEDGLHFIDYKTSATKPKGAKDKDGKLNVDVQLPLYLQAAAPELYPDEAVAGAQYYSLTKGETIANADVNDAELIHLTEQVKTCLAQGHFPVDPDPQEGACTYCPYDSVCRKGPRLARKRGQS